MNKEYVNNFLQTYVELYKQNPSLEISRDTFYHGLRSYGIPKEELQDGNIRQYFDEWIVHFNSFDGLKVYENEFQPGFLQFTQITGHKEFKHAEYVKLYLNFNKENICECVKKVFGFIDDKGISSYSKVADKMRSDCVVLRLENINDAKKVISYVNSDKFLVDNSRPVNPFLVKEGIVGMAFDGWLSYNYTLSILLEKFFMMHRNNNTLHYVNPQTFQNYIDLYIRELLEFPGRLKKFLLDSEQWEYFRISERGLIANNFIQILRLIKESFADGYDIVKYEESYRKFTSEINNELLNKYYQNYINFKSNDLYSEEEKQLLDDYIKYAALKYGDNKVYRYLSTYMCGMIIAVTRDNDFRKKFVTLSMSRKKIISITNNDLQGYIKTILNINKKPEIEEYNQFYNACIQTYLKYGTEQLSLALVLSLKQDYRYFTNENGNSRDYMINHFDQDTLKKCMYYLASSQETNLPNLIQKCLETIKNDALQLDNNKNTKH